MARNPYHSKQQQIPPTSHWKTEIKKQNETEAKKIKNQSKKCVTFTFHSANVRKTTNLFRHTDIKIAFKSTNTIHQQTRPKSQHNTQEYDKSSIYRLTYKPAIKHA
jgi:hypothetical protein